MSGQLDGLWLHIAVEYVFADGANGDVGVTYNVGLHVACSKIDRVELEREAGAAGALSQNVLFARMRGCGLIRPLDFKFVFESCDPRNLVLQRLLALCLNCAMTKLGDEKRHISRCCGRPGPRPFLGEKKKECLSSFFLFLSPSTCPRLWGGLGACVSSCAKPPVLLPAARRAWGEVISGVVFRSHTSAALRFLFSCCHDGISIPPKEGEKPPSLLVASGWGFSPLDDSSFGRLGGGPTVVSSSQGCSLRDVEGPSHAVMYSYNSD